MFSNTDQLWNKICRWTSVRKVLGSFGKQQKTDKPEADVVSYFYRYSQIFYNLWINHSYVLRLFTDWTIEDFFFRKIDILKQSYYCCCSGRRLLTACDSCAFIRSGEKSVDHGQVSILVQCWEEHPEENDQAGPLCCELLHHDCTLRLTQGYWRERIDRSIKTTELKESILLPENLHDFYILRKSPPTLTWLRALFRSSVTLTLNIRVKSKISRSN